MSKIVLRLEDDFDFQLIAISCHLKDYRLCYELNKNLELDLQSINELVISKQSYTAAFSLSLYVDDDNHKEYYLLSNKGTKGLLIPEHKSADFFLLLKGVFDPEDVSDLLDNLKRMDLILAAFTLQPESLKSKANLLF